MKGINRPSFPTVGSDPQSQRTLTAVNELTTALLSSGVVLSRVDPGGIARPSVATGSVGVLGLEWDSQNRVDVGTVTGIALLPSIKPAFVGRPLYMTKASPSGTVQVRPSGAGVLINSFSGITKQTAGLSVFLTDGTGWWAT